MSNPPIPRLARLALRFLSLLTPRELRERWLREWEGELTYWWRSQRAARAGGGLPGFPWAAILFRGPWLLLVAARDTWHLRSLRGSRAPEHNGPSFQRQPLKSMLSSILQDTRFGFRAVRSAPWLSLVTVVTLALGIGASVAMFGVLHGAFIRPLPFPDPDRLVVGRATVRDGLNPWVAGADYYDYRNEADAFEDLAAILPFPLEMTFSGEGEAERISGNVVSPSLFPVLQFRPVLGRAFHPEEGLEGAEDVVVISHAFWQGRLGGDPGAVGTILPLDGSPFTVVGVLPQNFFFMIPADLWLPMRPDQYAAASRGSHNWYLVGRLKSGISLDQAQAGVDVISVRLQEAYPDTNQDKALLLTGLHRVLTEDYRTSVWILTCAVALVLLIACGNGAGILLARAPARRFELSVRTAMGAPRGRLIRQLLTESLALALFGGVLGTVLAVWFQKVMLEYLSMERLGLADAGLSLPILAAALGVSLLAGLLAGVYPALKSADTSLAEGLKTGNRGRSDSGAGFRSGLVVAQVALSVILLAGSGLLVRSLSNLQALDPGFDARGLLTAEVQLPSGRYPDNSSQAGFFSTLHDELRGLPGVESAALTSHLPIGDFGNIYRAYAEGREDDPQRIFLRSVSPGYFGTLGTPVLSGRGVEEGDDAEAPNVVILSETAARRIFPDENPLGKVVALNLNPGPRPMEVVGVVGDVRLSRLEEEPEAALYLPYPQGVRGTMRVALRARTPPLSLTGALKEILIRMDPEVPLSRVATLENLVADSMAERRIITLSLAILALLPLLLASVGLFAVLVYHVSRRRHEMGVRMALGAGATHVVGLVLRQGLWLVGAGLLLGLAGAWGGTRLLQGLLFGVEAVDPLTFIAVTGLVLAVSVVACAVPGWRAARSDPRRALQAE